LRQLPQVPQDDNVRALAMHYREVIAGITGSTFSLQNAPASTVDGEGLEIIFKNGLLMTPGIDYALEGRTVTLASPANALDRFVCSTPYRAS
jgi:hypothetical protein